MKFTSEQLDLTKWQRRDHFDFFKNFEQPYFNVCVSLQAQTLFDYCKANDLPFFLSYVYLAQRAIQDYAPMRYRIVDGQPVCFEQLTASVVQLGKDNAFRFSYFDFHTNYQDYLSDATHASEQAQSQPLFSDDFNNTEGRADLVHVSVLPWIKFTAFNHATCEGNSHGIPKLVFGQYCQQSGTMPLSLDVHHALMDGLHSAQYIAQLQTLMNAPDKYL